MRPRSQKSTDSRRWLWRCVSPLKTVAMPKKWHLRARLHLFFAAMCRKWYLASLFLGENGAWSRLGRVDMDADEALQMFLTKKTAPTFPLRDFLPEICLRATMSSSATTGPAILPPLTRKPPAPTRKISMEGVDNQALTEKAVQSLRVSEFGQHYFTRTSWNLIFWVLWSLSFQNIWYFLFTKVNGCRVICTYSRGSQKWLFFTKL